MRTLLLTIAMLCPVAAFAGLPRGSNSCKCELIEFNLNEHTQYEQVIFWRWNVAYSRYDVRDWTKADAVEKIGATKVRFRGWTVEGPIKFTVTNTDTDPEKINKSLCPESERVGMPWSRPIIKRKAGFGTCRDGDCGITDQRLRGPR